MLITTKIIRNNSNSTSYYSNVSDSFINLRMIKIIGLNSELVAAAFVFVVELNIIIIITTWITIRQMP